MPKPTIAQACAKLSITRDQWDAARRAGVNPWNDAEMKAHLGKRRHRIKPDAKLPEGSDAETAQTIEEMEDLIRRSRDMDTVKILKEKIIALTKGLEFRVDSGELIRIGDVREALVRITSACRGELLKLSADLPPKLEGMTASAMAPVVRSMVIEILNRLSNEGHKAYH